MHLWWLVAGVQRVLLVGSPGYRSNGNTTTVGRLWGFTLDGGNGANAITGAISDADRTLIFTQSIKSANAIAAELIEHGVAAAPHHSEIDMTQRDDILRQFAEGELTVLVSVQTLEEGVDVPDADLAIIVASSKQRRQMVQRMGRVLRRKSDGRDARFIILFVALTDEDPRLGAHETFVDELIDVARDSMIGDLTMTDELRQFLRPHHD